MGDVLATRNEYRAQVWMQFVRECEASGMTNREFCQQRGISEKSYYYWLRKLRKQAVATAGPQLVPLKPVTIPESGLRIEFRGAQLVLPDGVDIEAVAAVLRSLQSL